MSFFLYAGCRGWNMRVGGINEKTLLRNTGVLYKCQRLYTVYIYIYHFLFSITPQKKILATLAGHAREVWRHATPAKIYDRKLIKRNYPKNQIWKIKIRYTRIYIYCIYIRLWETFIKVEMGLIFLNFEVGSHYKKNFSLSDYLKY